MAWVSMPPPRRASNSGTKVFSFFTFFLCSKISVPVLKEPISACSRAALMSFFAVASPISATSASSTGDAVAILSTVVYPASLSLSAVVGPTPGKSSISFPFPVNTISPWGACYTSPFPGTLYRSEGGRRESNIPGRRSSLAQACPEPGEAIPHHCRIRYPHLHLCGEDRSSHASSLYPDQPAHGEVPADRVAIPGDLEAGTRGRGDDDAFEIHRFSLPARKDHGASPPCVEFEPPVPAPADLDPVQGDGIPSGDVEGGLLAPEDEGHLPASV